MRFSAPVVPASPTWVSPVFVRVPPAMFRVPLAPATPSFLPMKFQPEVLIVPESTFITPVWPAEPTAKSLIVMVPEVLTLKVPLPPTPSDAQVPPTHRRPLAV